MKILIADPETASRDALRRAFAQAGDQVRSVASLTEGARQLFEFLPDALVVSVEFPEGDGVSLLEAASRSDRRRALYALIDRDRLEDGVRAMSRGAHDFVWRPVSPGRISLLRSRLAARREREGWLEETRVRLARSEMAASLAGRSPRWQATLTAIEREAALETPVLLTGEAGTEKEFAARAIHRLSRRGSEPFVVARDGEGLADAAVGEGTLYVPSVERLTVSGQRGLLTELERTTGRRLILATDQDPFEAGEPGRLVPELFEKLSGHVVHLPPLRERAGDIETLARQFLHEQNGSLYFDSEAIDVLLAHDWPDNVRELREAVRRACRLADGPSIGPTVVTSVLGRPLPTRRPRHKKPPVVRIAVGASLADVERRLIQKTLEFSRGSKPKTAQLLKLSLKTIYNKIKEYGLEH